jgi:hypothetical protein
MSAYVDVEQCPTCGADIPADEADSFCLTWECVDCHAATHPDCEGRPV